MEYSPVFILNQKDIMNLYEIIEPQKTNRNKNINYTINNFSFNYKPILDKNAILRSENNPNILKNENKEKIEKQEKENKWILQQINIENFELIKNDKQENSNEKGNFISVSESQNMQNINQINPEENNQIKSEINFQLISEMHSNIFITR